MEEKKESNPIKKWLKHDYAPMVMAAVAIILVMIVVYMFFAQRDGQQALMEEGPTLAYSQSIAINSSGPGGQGRVRMSYYLKTDEAYEEVLTSKEHVIRDLTIEKLLAWDKDALGTRDGMETFKKELQSLIYEETGIPVEGIYFQEFILN